MTRSRRHAEPARGTAIVDTGALLPLAEVRETHSAIVFLVGDRAYKLKKSVDLGFLDFSTREKRLAVLRRELELNRRVAPDVYLGVSDVLDVDGGPLDHLLVMRRMPAHRRLAHLVRNGADEDDVIVEVARLVAAFHTRCARGPQIDVEGERESLRARWRSNVDGARPFVGLRIDEAELESVSSQAERFLDGREPLLDDRIRRGCIVDGHGDLLADDIFCLADGPRVLDCLEFDDRLRHLDRIDDVACLAMDLERLGSPGAAATLLRTYGVLAADTAPSSLVHHYVAYRALMRAKVACLARGPSVAGSGAPSELMGLAMRHLEEGRVCLLLVGGPPGTGKSTLAAGLADRLGHVVLSSDRVRKELAGLRAESRSTAPLGEGIYAPAWTRRTYEELLHRTERLLGMGESVVIDATWSDGAARAAAVAVAERTSSDVVQLRCVLPEAVAAARIERREGVSDADATIASTLRESFEGWPAAYPIDTRPPPDIVVAQVQHRIQPWRTTTRAPRPRMPAG